MPPEKFVYRYFSPKPVAPLPMYALVYKNHSIKNIEELEAVNSTI
jgi:hypothetical protein